MAKPTYDLDNDWDYDNPSSYDSPLEKSIIETITSQILTNESIRKNLVVAALYNINYN